MKKRVLLVDDNFQLIEELSNVFAENNIEVFPAESGKAALTVANKESYDVAVVDIRLPDFNGVELVEQLRKIRPQAVNLLITGYASTETAIKALHKEVFDYIVKPFSPEELIVSVKKAFLVKDSTTAKENQFEYLLKEKSVLQAKVLMLEQVNELFMDREKKILQLKQEVNALAMEHGEKPKYVL
jgi:two-component system response regulator HydG